jgi:hypothetical protein
MVTQGIIGLILNLFSPIVNKLPEIDVASTLSSDGANTFLDWVGLAGYMLPFETFFVIFGIIVALQVFRIVIAFFKSLWGVLPVV